MDIVSIVRVKEDVAEAVRRGLDLLGGYKINDREKIVIKPNFCHPSLASTGRTVDLRVIEAMIDYILAKGNASISIVESDTFATSADRTFKVLGCDRLARKGAVQLVNLSKERKEARNLEGQFFKKLDIPETLTSYDKFITIAKLKTMLFERMTGTYKNQFGCLPYKEKRCFHPFLSEALYDLNTVFKPDICVIDGIVGLEGCGPIDGLPKTMNLLVFGQNPLSTDSVACHLMGIDPLQVPHLKYAYENNYGEIDISRIQLVGESIDTVRSNFTVIPESIYNYMRRGLRFGKLPAPIRNLGLLMFTYGNYNAGKTMSTRMNRQKETKTEISISKIMKKILWTRTWNM